MRQFRQQGLSIYFYVYKAQSRGGQEPFLVVSTTAILMGFESYYDGLFASQCNEQRRDDSGRDL